MTLLAHVHPFVVLFAFLLPFLYVRRLQRRPRLLLAIPWLAAAVLIVGIIYAGLSRLLLRQNQVDLRLLGVLAVPFALLFLSERSQIRDRLMRVEIVLMVLLLGTQLLLVAGGAMTGDASATDNRETVLRGILKNNWSRINNLSDKDRVWDEMKLTRTSPLWLAVRDTSTDIINADLQSRVLVKKARPTWHSFFTDLYWFHEEPRFLAWSGGNVDDGWFYIDGETPEEGKVRWEKMLNEQFPFGRPKEGEEGSQDPMGGPDEADAWEDDDDAEGTSTDEHRVLPPLLP